MLTLTPWRSTLLETLATAERSVYIVSPFIKTPIAAQIVGALEQRRVKVRTLTRFKPDDFAAGVSDLDAAWMLSSHIDRIGAHFELRTDDRLHAKIYLIDDKVAYVGSSNLTYSGLMRNYEAGVSTKDPKIITQILQELDAYWNRCAERDFADFTRMVALIRQKGRRRTIEEDHVYDTSNPVDVFQTSSEDLDGDLYWLQGSIGAAPIERITSTTTVSESRENDSVESNERQNESIAVEKGDELDGPGYRPDTTKSNKSLELLNSIDSKISQRVDEFLNSLEQMGVPARRNSLAYALCLRHPSLRAWMSIQTNTILASNVRLDQFLSAQYESSNAGRIVCEIAYWRIALKAGLISRYGRAGSSTLFNAARQHRILASQWHENFLGPLVSQGEYDENYQAAADHLIQTISFNEGLSFAIDFVESFFNPLDALGSDLGSILALKDSRTTMHDIAQAHSQRVVYFDAENLGSEHETKWRCKVKLGSAIEAHGSGSRKSLAEEDAARRALLLVRNHSTYSKTYSDLLAAGLTGARVRAFLLPRHALDRVERDRIQNAYRTVLGVDMEPTLGYSALLDLKTAKDLGLPGNHKSLTNLGRSLFNYGLLRQNWKGGRPSGRPVISREFWDEMPSLFDIPRLRIEAGFIEGVEREPMLSSLEAVLAALCLHLGWDSGLDVFDTAFETACRRLEELNNGSGRSGELIGDSLRALAGRFDPAVSYTQALHDFTQKVDQTTPTYEYVKDGPSHRPTFLAHARWGSFSGKAAGPTKGSARNQASYYLLCALVGGLEPILEKLRGADSEKDCGDNGGVTGKSSRTE